MMEQILKEIQQMNENFQQIDERFQKMDDRFEKLEEKMDHKFDMVAEQLDRMESTLDSVAKTANVDSIAILERIDKNTRSLNQDIEFLSKKSGRHELYFNRIQNS
ncbi:hypothetical protein [Neobacillus sp. D3-1R]|uniref:hypothetical protein n=1 Tax=Neobacillus sp. D3-1R TaxID=3445778 RepID=UPI003F9F0C8C